MIGPPEAIARAILAHDPLGVALTTLHIEWMVQRHYVDSVKDDQELDPQFKSLLKHHWMEEVQHAKLDTLMVESLAAGRSEEQVMRGVEEYIQIGGFIDGGLTQQVEFDLDSFERATGRQLTEVEKEEFRSQQLQANRWTYLGTGMTHEKVLETLAGLTPKARQRIESISLHSANTAQNPQPSTHCIGHCSYSSGRLILFIGKSKRVFVGFQRSQSKFHGLP